jgi:hypothetical protein
MHPLGNIVVFVNLFRVSKSLKNENFNYRNYMKAIAHTVAEKALTEHYHEIMLLTQRNC